MKLVFVGMGEVGHWMIKYIITHDVAYFKQMSFVLIDNDKIEARNPSYSDYTIGNNKVAVAGYELSLGLGLPISELPFIPIVDKPDPEITIINKRASIQELSLLNKKNAMIVETTDNHIMQNILGLHVHTGSIVGHIGFSIRFGTFNLSSSKREIGDCPQLFSDAARSASEPAVKALQLLMEMTDEERLSFKPIVKTVA